MPRKSKVVNPGVRKYGVKSNYTKATFEEALGKIRSGVLTRIEASKKYNIPPVTLFYKLKQKHDKSVGRPTALTQSEEESFKSHLLVLTDMGIPISMLDFRVLVKKYLDSHNRKILQFHNNMPGYEWGALFLERYPELKKKIGHNITKTRAQVNREQLEHVFTNISKEIEGIPPENIFNMDESGFPNNPGKKKLLFRKAREMGELTRAGNIRAGFRSSGMFSFSPEKVLSKFPKYTSEVTVRGSVGEAFQSFIKEVRSSDLGEISRGRKFQLPVIAGKREVENFYADKAKGTQSQGRETNVLQKKRGRPAGSRNKKKQKVSDPENSNDESEEDFEIIVEAEIHKTEIPKKRLQNIKNIRNLESIERIKDVPVEHQNDIIQDVDDITCNNETMMPDEITAGMFCIFNYEGTIFPGSVIRVSSENITLNVFKKEFLGGWTMYPKIQKCVIRKVNVISQIKEHQINRSNGKFFIDSEILFMEWGE